MNRIRRSALALGLGAAVAAPLLAGIPAQAADHEDYEVLVVGKTLGFRHSSIDEATTAIIALGEANGFTVDVWDPPTTGGPFGPSAGQPTRTLPSTPFTSAEDLRVPLAFNVFLDPSRTPAFQQLLEDTVRATYPEHEQDKFMAHFGGLLDLWVVQSECA